MQEPEEIYTAKVALDPSPRQERQFYLFDWGARAAFNFTKELIGWEIACNWEAHDFRQFWSFYSMRKIWNQWKDVVFPRWHEISKEALASGIKDACQAFDNWYTSLIGKRKGDPVGYPHYRSFRGGTHSFDFTTGSFGLMRPNLNDPKAVRVPRVGRVHAFENVRKRVSDGTVSSMRVFLDGERWYASLLVKERTPERRSHKKRRGPVGLDVGCKNLVATSDGVVVESPRFDKRSQKKTRRDRKRLSRRKGSKKGERPSKSFAKARKKLAKDTAHVRHQRKDLLQKTADFFCRNFRVIFIEDLKPKNMSRKGGARKKGLNRSIRDASFAMFRDCLEQQAKKYGSEIHVIDRWYPSTKTCSCCGHVKDVGLDERVYDCPVCGNRIDRDVNAAINIRNEGLRDLMAESASVTAGGEEGCFFGEAGTKQARELAVRLGAAIGNDGLINCYDVSSAGPQVIAGST